MNVIRILYALTTNVLLKYFEGVALGLEPFDGCREGCAELVDTFQGVVEGDDAAVTGVALDIVQHVVGREPFGVVAGNKVPHNDAELA